MRLSPLPHACLRVSLLRFRYSVLSVAFALLMVASSLLPNRAQAQIFDWTNTGNVNSFYDITGNWSPLGPPTGTQTARFNSANTYEVRWDSITGTPSVGFVQVNSGDVTFLNLDNTSQHGLTINGSGGSGSFSDFSISGATTSLTVSGLHLQSLGGAQIIDGATMTLDGTHAQGANLTIDGSIGFQVDGNLNVEAGGVVSNTRGYIGKQSTSVGVATVTGSGSQWINSGALVVGHAAHGTLNVEAGGLVSNTDGLIGYVSGSTGTATVTGSGSQWNNSSLSVGYERNGTLNVEAGGLVNSTDGTIGRFSTSTGTATVTGSGSQWNNSSSLSVGYEGNGTLNVEAGGLVRNTTGYIGRFKKTGTATVTGSGSQWNNSSSLSVGYERNGTLNVEDGGLVSNFFGYIGRISGSTGTATVTGSGSQWNNTGELYVGRSGSGTLNVEAGGLVSNTTGYIAAFSGFYSTGTATVTGSGSQWNNSSDLYVGGSPLGAGGSATLTIADNGLVSVVGTTKLWSQGSLILNTGGILDTQTLDLTAGSFDMLNDGVLHADYVLGNLFNESGVLSPGNSPGITNISGSYVQGSAATLEIELGGLTGGLFDQLLISGDADWNGMLDVSLYGGFSLSANQQFQIATVSGIQTGMFTGLGEGDLVGNFGGRDLFITYNGFGGTAGVGLFTAVPEPGTAGLLGGCLLLGWASIRRRRGRLSI